QVAADGIDRLLILGQFEHGIGVTSRQPALRLFARHFDPLRRQARGARRTPMVLVKSMNSLLFFANARVAPAMRVPVSMGHDGDAIMTTEPSAAASGAFFWPPAASLRRSWAFCPHRSSLLAGRPKFLPEIICRAGAVAPARMAKIRA